MKLWKFLSDIKLGFLLLKREGIVSFFHRLLWYVRGQRLNEDIFARSGEVFEADWIINIPTSIENGPLLSVIVPLYNHENFIKQGLESIIHQTYKNIEIIVIDDGSVDNSYAVAKKTLERGCRPFICFSQENKGAHVTINTGIAKAKGKYLAILNSDDYFEVNRFSILLGELEKSDSEIAFSGVEYVNELGIKIKEGHQLAGNFTKKQKYASQFPSVGFALLDSNMAISTGNFVFTKELYEKIGGFSDLKFCHDWDFILSSLKFCEPIFINQRLYSYRFHGDNTFLRLQNILKDEHRSVLSKFLSTTTMEVGTEKFPNKKNWGSYFDQFIKVHGYRKYLDQ